MEELVKGDDLVALEAMIKATLQAAQVTSLDGATFANSNGTTMLFVACMHRKTDAVRMLLKYGANPNIVGRGDWQPPLNAAINLEDHESIAMLIEAGADLSKPCGRHTTPIMLAIRMRRVEIVKMLWMAGLNLHEMTQPVAIWSVGKVVGFKQVSMPEYTLQVCLEHSFPHDTPDCCKIYRELLRMINCEVMFHFAPQVRSQVCSVEGAKKFTLPDEFVRLLHGIF